MFSKRLRKRGFLILNILSNVVYICSIKNFGLVSRKSGPYRPFNFLMIGLFRRILYKYQVVRTGIFRIGGGG